MKNILKSASEIIARIPTDFGRTFLELKIDILASKWGTIMSNDQTYGIAFNSNNKFHFREGIGYYAYQMPSNGVDVISLGI